MLFHGSYTKIQTPEIQIGKYSKDFGKGFYCTQSKEQAIKWANKNATPVVNGYQHLLNINLDVKIFDGMNEEWLDFLILCRSSLPDELVHAKDLIIGPMVDEQIYNHITDLLQGTISREAFWALTKFNYPTHQACFATEKALSSLKFLRSWDI